jgi:DUF2075 family protein
MTVAEFQEEAHQDIEGLVARLQLHTVRGGAEEVDAWRSSLPCLAQALSAPELAPLHLYFAGSGYLALEYQLPAASSWCDAVLLGRREGRSRAVVVELKNWITRGDRPGPYEGLMERGGQVVLHPSDQVRGYVEYCRRFHSGVQDRAADVQGCVLFTQDFFTQRYGEPPNDRLVREFPCFTMAPDVREPLTEYLVHRLDSPDAEFARAFVDGRYRQDRGFVRQIGAQILDPRTPAFALLDHQRLADAMVQARIEERVLGRAAPRKQVILIDGPPGSGKSVLAAHIWASLVTDERLPEGSVVLTTTSTAQTSNWSRLFQVAGTSRAAAGVVRRAASYVPLNTQGLGRVRTHWGGEVARDPAAWREHVAWLRNRGVAFQDGANDEQYLVSVVDEAHALVNPEHVEGRGQFGFAPTLGPLAFHIIRASTVSIFLLDSEQGFRDRENTSVDDLRRWAHELGAEVTDHISLEGAQFRCAGSTQYVEWLESVLRGDPAEQVAPLARSWRGALDFRTCETPFALEAALREQLSAGRDARLLASYAREWRTKAAASPHSLPPNEQDFHEPCSVDGQLRYWSKVWNFVPQNGSDYTWFIQAPPGSPMHGDPLCEVGCPYSVRGFDFDYVGVLWLSDLVWRGDRWQVDVSRVHDTGLSASRRAARGEYEDGPGHERLRQALRQAYRILLTRGIHGCYLWVEDEETRDHLLRCIGGEAPVAG